MEMQWKKRLRLLASCTEGRLIKCNMPRDVNMTSNKIYATIPFVIIIIANKRHI
jgi:hypothetical protein